MAMQLSAMGALAAVIIGGLRFLAGQMGAQIALMEARMGTQMGTQMALMMGTQMAQMEARMGTQMGTQMAQMEARMGTQMAQMEARMGTQTGAQMALMEVRMGTQTGAQMALMEARFNSSMDFLGSRIDSLDSRMDGLGSRIDSLDSRMGSFDLRMSGLGSLMYGLGLRMSSLTNSVDGLLASTLTPAAAQATLACAQASVYVLFMFNYRWNKTLNAVEIEHNICSAFSYTRHGGEDNLVVSARHCFENATDIVFDATRLALARDSRVKCHLLDTFWGSDAAVLRCEDKSPPLLRTGATPVFAQAVVAAGFFSGSSITSPLSVHEDYSMHVLSSTVAVSLGPFAEAEASARGLVLQSNLPPFFGMLQGKVLKGMSGGPVLDVHCGVVGIISGFSTNTFFYPLDEVDAWMLLRKKK
jgi:hypothetical protein